MLGVERRQGRVLEELDALVQQLEAPVVVGSFRGAHGGLGVHAVSDMLPSLMVQPVHIFAQLTESLRDPQRRLAHLARRVAQVVDHVHELLPQARRRRHEVRSSGIFKGHLAPGQLLGSGTARRDLGT